MNINDMESLTHVLCVRGEGGWGDGEGYMGNIWEGMELIKADRTGGEGKSQRIEYG